MSEPTRKRSAQQSSRGVQSTAQRRFQNDSDDIKVKTTNKHPVKKEKQKIVASLPENEFWEQFLSLDSIKVKDKDIGRIV